VARARRNEDAAARRGLEAALEDPYTGSPVKARDFLAATLEDLRPLAEALDYLPLLEPIAEMAKGAPDPAQAMRAWFLPQIQGQPEAPTGHRVVPRQLVQAWLDRRVEELQGDLERLQGEEAALGDEAAKLGELLRPMEEAGAAPAARLHLGQREEMAAVTAQSDPVAEVLALSQTLCRIPSVTNCPRERLDEVWRCARTVAGYLRDAGAQVRLFEGGKYPSVLAGFPGHLLAPVTLGGHFDVVEPDPNDTQFEPRVDGDYLWARGAADMKTVVASDMVWLRRTLAAGPPYPSVNLLLVGNEENGETEPYGTPHVLRDLKQQEGWQPEFMLLGERTGEKGDELFGEICTANRGVVRLRVVARGERAHTGMAGTPNDMSLRLIQARRELEALLGELLTLQSPNGWATGLRFPFFACGEAGVYNITPAEGVLGLEIRPIPEDGVGPMMAAMRTYCAQHDLEVVPEVMEGGVACPVGNPHLARLLAAAQTVQGAPPKTGRKLAGTSARFAPGGNAVVWGQTGIGPHTRHERHFIPSIQPYLDILAAFARSLPADRRQQGR
jgi:succinyl-diaminopimelate desuccinylase